MNCKDDDIILIMAGTLFDEPSDVIERCKQHTQGDYSIVLLDNPKAIREEGDAMKHCVASYVYLVARKEYLVYSIMKNGERVSTVGYCRQRGEWEIQQQYGKCNSIIQDDAEKFIALEMLNKLMKGVL